LAIIGFLAPTTIVEGRNGIWMWMNLDEPKLMSKHQLFSNSCYILFFVVAFYVNCGKLCLLNNMDIEKSKMNQKIL
jgi:uncharacterized membrane protein